MGFSTVIDLLLSFGPALLWLWYFRRQDRFDKEPFRILLAAFFLGALAIIPSLLAEWFADDLISNHMPFNFDRLLLANVVVGVVEELFKFLAVYLFIYRLKCFNEPMDGIIYCVTAAIGFAAFENLGYIVMAKEQGGLAAGLAVGAARALFSMFGHASFAVVMGSYMGRAKFEPARAGRLLMVGLAAAMILHAFYDFALEMKHVAIIPLVVLICLMLIYRNVNRALVAGSALASPFRPEPVPDNLLVIERKSRWRWSAANIISLALMVGLMVYAFITFGRLVVHLEPVMGFQVALPAHWEQRTDITSHDRNTVAFTGPEYRGGQPYMRLRVQELVSIPTLEDASQTSYEEDLRNVKSLATRSLTTSTVSGRPALIRICTWNLEMSRSSGKESKLVPMHSLLVYVINANRLYTLRLSAPERDFQEYSALFYRIINSLQLQEPEKEP